MRQRRHGPAGCAAIIAGVVILLALLPTEFWWFALAAVLIAVGVWVIRSC